MDLGYKYPTKERLVPGTEYHEKLKNLILTLARDSYSVISERHSYWEAIDKVLRAYIDLDDEEKKVLEKDSRKPTSIVIPVAFAALETILTYLTAAFINSPVFRYEGWDETDSPGVALLEMLVEYQVKKAKVPLALHTIWRDGLAYGLGVGVVGFVQSYSRTTRRPMPILEKLSSMFPGLMYHREQIEIVDQTSTLTAIDPYTFLPDVNVPVVDVQKMNYVGWITQDTYYSMKLEEEEDEGMFNVEYLKHVRDGRLPFYSRTPTYNPTSNEEISKPIDSINMFIKLIPSEYGLSKSKRIEKWFFTLAAGEVIVRAEKLDDDHGLFPIVVTSPDYDGHSVDPVSRIEVLFGMQKTIDWLFSSHITNVRKAINDMLIVDPYLINMNDLKNPDAGRIIRLRKSAWGRGVSGAVEQLKVVDVTSQNISDAMFLLDIIQRVSGATDIIQGIMRRSSERRSATEAAGVRESSLTRLEHIAKIISYQMMQDIGYMFASQTIQYMSDTLIQRIGGKVADKLAREYGVSKVDPSLLNIDYDVKVHDGSIPGGENGQLWVELYRILTSNPGLAQRFDLVRVFKHIARTLGAKDVDVFELKVKPTQEVIAQQQAGNIATPEELLGGGQNEGTQVEYS